MSHSRRKMKAYGEKEQHGHYILDDYEYSRNHTKAITIRRWKRLLKKKARQYHRGILHSRDKEMFS